MFKFRKPTVCSSVSPEVDLFNEKEAGPSGVGVQGGRSEQGDSVPESRFSVLPPSKDDRQIEQEILPPQHCKRRGSASSCSVSFKPLQQGLSDSSGSIHGKTLVLDRKRKERHESTSQGQEKKVIRSVSDDESLTDNGRNSDFRRTLSHDNFNQPKEVQLLNYNIDMVKQIGQEFGGNGKQQISGDKKDEKRSTSEQTGSTAEDPENFGMGAEPQFDVMRKVTVSENYEPELQRQLERSANWSSVPPTVKKTHHRRRHRSSRREAAAKQPLDVDIEVSNEDGQCEDVELPSPTASESSSSDSMQLQEELAEERNGLPSVEIEEVEDVTSQTSDKLMALGFSNAQQKQKQYQHSIEHGNAISIMAALGGTSADDEVMLSPRNSVLGKEGIDIPPSPPLHQAPMDPPISRQGFLEGNPVTKMNELSRQITALKRTLKKMECDYEQVYGYKPSHSDKLNHKEMRKCVLQLTKAKKELKQIREDPSCLHNMSGISGVSGNILCVSRGNSIPPAKGTPEYARYLETTVREIEKTLAEKRRAQNRMDDIEQMNGDELQEEKCLMQRQLLVLEKRHGRPSSKQEKDIVRPLYERYRAIKRQSVKIVYVREAPLDLAPIMEHETLEFNEGVDDAIEPRPSLALEVWTAGDRRQLIGSVEDEQREEKNESYNSMSIGDLETRFRQAKDEKRRMRSAIRRFENDFQNMTGRLPLKEEKYSSPEMEQAYQKYKRVKATVRLLDVLIGKRRVPALIPDTNENED